MTVTDIGPGLELNGLRPGDTGYDDARSVWNAMIDERPAVIVPCRTAEEVAAAVRAAAQDAPISIKGGGHNVAGTAVRDGAITIDLSPMREVAVDPARRIARVGGGATLADIDAATQVHGLAVPLGVVSETGVGGLALGGGFGWLSRLHGLAADNIVAAEMVLAEGRIVRASAESEPDLFWAIRGGGGNFGVVTTFEFRLHPVGPEVLFGPTMHRIEDAPDALRFYAEFMATAPRACTVWADLATAPPAPFLPEEVHGQPVLILMQCWAGPREEGEAALAPLRGHGTPAGDAVAWRPYVEAQQFLDAAYGKGARNYWSAQNQAGLSAGLIDDLVELGRALPTPESDILICGLGGAVDDVAPDATAYPHRGTAFMTTPGVRWRDAAKDSEMVAWLREGADRLAAHAPAAGAYANFIAEREGRAADAYGGNQPRLAAVKATYDPGNRFRVNQNVPPAAAKA